jgi:hypothetical protein
LEKLQRPLTPTIQPPIDDKTLLKFNNHGKILREVRLLTSLEAVFIVRAQSVVGFQTKM